MLCMHDIPVAELLTGHLTLVVWTKTLNDMDGRTISFPEHCSRVEQVTRTLRSAKPGKQNTKCATQLANRHLSCEHRNVYAAMRVTPTSYHGAFLSFYW